MKILKNYFILILTATITYACGPSPEQIAATMVVQTAEYETKLVQAVEQTLSAKERPQSDASNQPTSTQVILPTYTVYPTHTSIPTFTNTPHIEPSPRPSATATDQVQIPDPDPPINLTGTGQTATKLLRLPSPMSRAIFQHTGNSNFIVTLYTGNDKTLLINEIGPYRGAVLVMASQNIMFDIDADGTWIATIEGIGLTESPAFSGKSDNVSDFFTPPQLSSWSITHNGTSNFIVKYHCIEGRKMVINEIGYFSGTTIITFKDGPCLWEVQADGTWNIRPN
jgi:hypothetical protein